MSFHDLSLAHPALARDGAQRPPQAAPCDRAPDAPERPASPCGDACDELRCPVWRLCRGWGG